MVGTMTSAGSDIAVDTPREHAIDFPEHVADSAWRRDPAHLSSALVARMLTDDPEWRPRLVPLTQFIMDWNQNDHEARLKMVATAPDADCDEFYRVATAAVAHALCDRDGVAVPSWITQCVLPEDSLVVPDVSPSGRYGQLVRENAPPIGRVHRLYFESDWLATT